MMEFDKITGQLLLCLLVMVVATALTIQSLQASNTPCSGRKGGVSHCQGSTFICNDGSVSASKKNCAAYMGGRSGPALGLMETERSDMTPAGDDANWSCRSGHFCTGPRGGHYCITDNGTKSYLRN